MLAKVRVAFFGSNLLAANIAHGVPAVADKFVAAGGFDEAEKTFRAGSLNGRSGRGFDGGAK
jgi:hypothetical protein